MNLGHILLVVIATIVGFILYDNVTCVRRKEYFETHEMSREKRKEMEKDAWIDRITVIVRLVIWCLCAVFALANNILGIILTIAFTLDYMIYVYYHAYSASKARAAALTFLAIPFGALIAAYGMMSIGIVWGILLGILAIVLVQICRLIGWQLSKEDD